MLLLFDYCHLQNNRIIEKHVIQANLKLIVPILSRLIPCQHAKAML